MFGLSTFRGVEVRRVEVGGGGSGVWGSKFGDSDVPRSWPSGFEGFKRVECLSVEVPMGCVFDGSGYLGSICLGGRRSGGSHVWMTGFLSSWVFGVRRFEFSEV